MNFKYSHFTIIHVWILALLLPTSPLIAQHTTLPNVKTIRLEKAGAVISVAEVIVKSGGNNIAQAGIAQQSSMEYNGPAALAIDGNTDGNYFNSSVTHTAPNDSAPWWQLTLPQPSSIEEIVVWNRTDTASSRLEEVRLVLRDEGGNLLAETVLTGDVSNTFRFVGSQLVLTSVTKKASLLAQENTSFASIGENPGRYRLHYDQPAPLTLNGWETQSLPLGNGHFGVSFFGGIAEELWQFSEKSLCVSDDTKDASAWDRVGFSNLMELRLNMAHGSNAIQGYGRELELDHAIGRVRYTKAGVEYRRELLTSYPDRVFAVRLTASELGKLSFTLNASQPFIGASRTGTATAQGAELVLKGVTKPFELSHEIRIGVDAKGGTVTSSASGSGATLQVTGSDEVVVYVTLGTSYQLKPNVFLQNNDANKLAGYPVPTERIQADLASAIAKGFTALLERHVADYSPIFERAVINLGGKAESYPLYLTNQLLRESNKTSEQTRFLEELYFQYGRYLLIASSRKGTLPANLQGTWNMTRSAPWTGGYWANINIQMNYWPAFSTNIEETFEPYWKFF